jgi:hypothetical protein
VTRIKPILTKAAKISARKIAFVESRFQILEGVRKRGRKLKVRCSDGVWEEVTEFRFRLDLFGKDLASKNFRLPPFSMKDWHFKWRQLKYGTWANVSEDFGYGDWELREFRQPIYLNLAPRKKTRRVITPVPVTVKPCLLTHHHGSGERCVRDRKLLRRLR